MNGNNTNKYLQRTYLCYILFAMNDNEKYIIAIFTDIRGFTEWAENQNAYSYADVLIERFNKALQNYFSKYSIKKLGDGAMLTQETDATSASNSTDEIINAITDTTKAFEKICTDFENEYGQKTDLKLGWGVTRGTVKKIDNNDYLGGTLNRAARLCGIARPFGIVLDKYNFKNADKTVFFEETYPIKGIEKPIECLVTKEIANNFEPREKRKEMPEVHIAGVCFRENNGKTEILIAKRLKTRELYPSLYECCGGQLKANEDFKTGVIRHYRTEMNISVDIIENVQPIIYSIKKDNLFINGLLYLCKFIEGVPTSINHEVCEWKTLEEINAINDNLFIPNLKTEIQELLNGYNL